MEPCESAKMPSNKASALGGIVANSKMHREGRPTCVEVDLTRIRGNFMAVRAFLKKGVRIVAVVKGDAYGHGAVPVSRCLEKAGVDGLAVAILEEALELRAAGIRLPILILNGFWCGQEEQLIRQELTPAVYHEKMVSRLSREARRLKIPARYQVKIDTGMTRLGMPYEQASEMIKRCLEKEWALCQGLYTHLSSAEEVGSPTNQLQIERFKSLLETLSVNHVQAACSHVVNSAGILNFRHAWFDAVRPGLILYGINPLANPAPLTVEPVLSFKTSVMQIKSVKAGTAVGYGGTYIVSKDSRVAILPVGYADGLNRLISTRGCVLINGQRVPIAGRISMDLTAVEAGGQLQVRQGDEVCLIGRQGDAEISVQEVAEWCSTIPYEVLCRIGKRVPRIYHD